MTNEPCRRCGEPFAGGLDPGDYEGICPACLAGLATEADLAPSGAAADDPPPLKRGATFRGLEILDLIGRGGMGVVYKARQIELGRVVALKILSPRLAADPEFSRRFTREAQALAALDHPHVVRVHDVGREGELCFLVMEFVDGATLRELLVGRRLPADQALRLIPQLCEALEYAHSRGVIHRDVKPENILVSRDGTAKIADFGLAKIVSDDPAVSTLTRTDVVMGTVNYMAPEQREGRREADHRADIYSLGVVFYELLTGELPVGRFELPSRKSPVDGRLDEVVLRALEKDPARRYQRAGELGEDLRRVSGGAPPPADCAVVDLRAGGKALGLVAGRRITVHAVACRVFAMGWDRPEIGLNVDGDFEFKPEAARIRSGADTRRISVWLPVGAELDLAVEESNAGVFKVMGAVKARVPDSLFEVVDHDGPIQADALRMTVDGLRSEAVDLRARTGELLVKRFRLTGGRARIEAEGGPLHLDVAPGSSFRYALETAHGAIEGPASGQVGAGAGTLSARAAAGIRFRADALSLHDFLARLTKADVEKLGVYAIVNAGLFLFFGLVAGTVAPAVIVAVFWGMGLGLQLWKNYIQGTPGRSLTEAVPGIVRKAMALVPTPAPKPEPPPPPPPPPARTSKLAVIALLFSLPAALAGAGAAIALLMARSAVLNLSTYDVSAALTWAMVCGAVAAGAGVLGAVLGLTAAAHVNEARGARKGRGLAQAAVTLSVAALLLAGLWLRPELRTRQRSAETARESVAAFVERLQDRRWDDARQLLAREARERTVAADLERMADRIKARTGGERATLRGRARLAADGGSGHWSGALETGRIHLGYAELRLVREGGIWRIVDPRDLFGGRP